MRLPGPGRALGPLRRLVRRQRFDVRRDRRAVVSVAGAVVLAALAALGGVRGCDAPQTVRLVAAGDMACDPDDPRYLARSEAEGDYCRHDEVSTLAVGLAPKLLLGLGDYQYELPTTDAYRDVYGPSWGRLRSQTIPVFGNQEYKVRDASTFTAYFGDRIRDPRGYWSQDVGEWHVVVLNSNCTSVAGGCALGSPQQRWLEEDLAGTDKRCVLAAWHHPRWSSGLGGPDQRTGDLYRTLYEHRAELLLSGHEADYERFGPLDPTGKEDPEGVRQYVVGTGGQAHYSPWSEEGGGVRGPGPQGDFFDFSHHGVLELELRPGGWAWRFHALDAGVVDQGEATCH